jgi:hypothetical protein
MKFINAIKEITIINVTKPYPELLKILTIDSN